MTPRDFHAHSTLTGLAPPIRTERSRQHLRDFAHVDTVRRRVEDSRVPLALAIIPGLPGGPEVFVILIVGLVLFGGRLPEVGKSIGRSIVEFRKGLRGLKDEVGLDREMRDIRRDFEEASSTTAAWPEDANPWAEVTDPKPSAPAEGDVKVTDAETVTPEKDAGEAPTPPVEGPVARGDLGGRDPERESEASPEQKSGDA